MEQCEKHVLGSKGALGSNSDASIYCCEPVPISTMGMTSVTSRAPVGQRRRDTWRSVSMQEMAAPSPSLLSPSITASFLQSIINQSIQGLEVNSSFYLPVTVA